MITPEQAQEIKKQILKQVEKFPPEKRDIAKQQIEAMNEEQLEEFLVKNNLIQNKESSSEQKCIFCSIIFGDVPTHKIRENKVAIATLEINPISKGHSLVIPKEHIPSSDKFPEGVKELAEEIAEDIRTKLKPKEVIISSSNLFGHEILNVLPVYKNENLKSPRKPATPEELQELQKILTENNKEEKVEEVEAPTPEIKKIKPEKLWLPQRIP